MDADISEFSYGYALTSELVHRFALKSNGAPEFPTQVAEGKKGGGWDMKLPGIPVYLQFKRASRMVRRSAQDSGVFTELPPFYRMHLHRRDHSDQHRLLLDLESEGNTVAYASPAFSKPEELNAAYSEDRVSGSSIFVRPSAIEPLTDNEVHWVAFQSPPPVAFYCSEPLPIESVSPKTLFSERPERREGQRARPRLYRDLAEELLEIYSRSDRREVSREGIEKIQSTRERRTAPDYVQLVSRTLYQCTLLYLQE